MEKEARAKMLQKRQYTNMFDEMVDDFICEENYDYGICINRKGGKEKSIAVNAEVVNILGRKVEGYLVNVLKKELQVYFKIGKYKQILIVGLGNREVLNDALGVRTAEKMVVSRGLELYPQVSVIAPNVCSNTGIETADIVKSICEKINPDLVIFIDSLATISLSRLCCSFQISEGGIIAGSGSNSLNKKIDASFLGVKKVISIGVPMLIYAKSLLEEKLDEIENASNVNEKWNERYEKELIEMKEKMFKFSCLILSPCDIGSKVNLIAEIISKALNYGIFKKLKSSYIDLLIK